MCPKATMPAFPHPGPISKEFVEGLKHRLRSPSQRNASPLTNPLQNASGGAYSGAVHGRRFEEVFLCVSEGAQHGNVNAEQIFACRCATWIDALFESSQHSRPWSVSSSAVSYLPPEKSVAEPTSDAIQARPAMAHRGFLHFAFW